MRNIKLILEYDGTNYSGWQLQNKQFKNKTIQKRLEEALSKILQEKVRISASGRTDAGVHALGQVANFKTKTKLSSQNIQRALNSLLPEDIRIKEVKKVPLNFHACFSAQSKLYRYTVVNAAIISPFLYRYAHLIKYPLDVQRMRQAIRYFLGKHNFRSFQAVDKKERPAIRTIKRLAICKNKNLITLDMEADGFLYRMARNIVGTLMEVGRGRIKPEQIKEMLKAKNRVSHSPCAPAKGLCLLEVKYKN